ncbi:MAG: amidohydrolase [Chloroflexi bacterium]|nr:MAG: amidohydrolase [Chloroflexota bacterium]
MASLGHVPRWDLHTHYYPQSYFRLIEEVGGDFSFAKSPTGQTIIRFRGSRFFGITPPMTDPAKRLEDMDRVGIDVEVLSLSTPNVYFAPSQRQAEVARLANDAYADLAAKHPKRFKGFASIPMDDPDGALRELDRALGELRMQGVVILSNFVHPMIPANAEAFSEYVLGPIIGFPFDTTLAVARLCYAGVFRQLPRIRWILGHLGGAVPYLFERLDNGWRDFAECRANIDELPSVYLRRLYYDTVSFSAPSLRLAMEQVGAEHLVMGSDYPHLLGSIERSVSSIESLSLGADQKEAIFSGNARAILSGL